MGEQKSVRKRPIQKVLIGLINPLLDPVRKTEQIDQSLSPQEQWLAEGPILKIARRLFEKELPEICLVYLLYTKLSKEGERRKRERISQGISKPPHVSFEDAKQRAELTKDYLVKNLKLYQGNVRLWELLFDEENVADSEQWLKTIPRALQEIQEEYRSESRVVGEENELVKRLHVVIVEPGSQYAREVLNRCLKGNLITAELWKAPDPNYYKSPKVAEMSHQYKIEISQAITTPTPAEQKAINDHILAISRIGEKIDVFVGGHRVAMGRESRNNKAALLYYLATEAKNPVSGRPRTRTNIRLPWYANRSPNYLSELRNDINKIIYNHTKSLIEQGKQNSKLKQPIPKLITPYEWSLTIPPQEIYVQ